MANQEKTTKVSYYAEIPAEKSTTGKVMGFVYSRTSRRGIPSDYRWEENSATYTDSLDDLMYVLHNVLALEIDRGFNVNVESVEIHKVTKEIVTATTDELMGKHPDMDAITDIGESKYGWNDQPIYERCPECGEDGWTGDVCPNCGHNL
ncbi:MAG: hypothetical protein MJZ25_08855 [Fibrobacter sp.]|nr:hypothetical protein [Fibrobacter sp.]